MRRTAFLPALACFATLALLMALPALKYERGLRADERDRVALNLSAYAAALSAAVTQRLALVVGVNAFMQAEPAGSGELARFESFAEGVYRSAPGIRAIQLIRDDVIRSTWPRDGNEKVLGWNLALDHRERVRTEYLRTLQTRQIAISGPFVLLQGGLALIARLAVRDPAGKVRSVVAVIVDVPLLMKQVELDPPPPSLAIALRDQTGQVFWGDPAVFSSDPVVQHLELQDGAWDLAATPRPGWGAHVGRRIWLFRSMALLIAALTSLVVFLLVHGLAARVQHIRALERARFEVLRKAMRVIGHEVNNSLAPVKSMLHSARQMARRPELAPRLEPVLGMIAERTDHLRSFLDGYSQLARLPPPVKAPVEWKPFLEEMALLYPFRLAGQPPSDPAAFDRSQIQQVLINLLKNARESGSAPDQVEVEVRRDGELTIAVRDRGAGMKPEDLARAGEPFFTTKPGGTGLGLQLCREVVRAHGGALDLSPRPGGGLEARIHLPV